MNYTQRMPVFLAQQRGALTSIAAISFSIIISLSVFAFDGIRLILKKARLEEALNETSQIISNPDFYKHQRSKSSSVNHPETILANYINAYLPDAEITNSKINISYVSEPGTGKAVPVFDIQARVKVKTILPLNMLSSFSSDVQISALDDDNGLCQRVLEISNTAVTYLSGYLHTGAEPCPELRY